MSRLWVKAEMIFGTSDKMFFTESCHIHTHTHNIHYMHKCTYWNKKKERILDINLKKIKSVLHCCISHFLIISQFLTNFLIRLWFYFFTFEVFLKTKFFSTFLFLVGFSNFISQRKVEKTFLSHYEVFSTFLDFLTFCQDFIFDPN